MYVKIKIKALSGQPKKLEIIQLNKLEEKRK